MRTRISYHFTASKDRRNSRAERWMHATLLANPPARRTSAQLDSHPQLFAVYAEQIRQRSLRVTTELKRDARLPDAKSTDRELTSKFRQSRLAHVQNASGRVRQETQCCL